MTVSSTVARSGPYTGNGVTTSFAYGFRILSTTDLTVVKTQNDIDTTVPTTEYSVTGVGNGAGGSVVFAVAPPTGVKINIIRNLQFTQLVDLENQGEFFAEVIEEALDRAAMRDQQLSERLDRAITIPVGSPITGTQEAVDTLLAFGAIYLGARSSEPVVRNDGSPLTGGELFFDIGAGALSVYTGTAWNPINSAVNGTLSRQTYTATSGQTVFAINYDVGFVDVWLNGFKLVAGDDFTATTGTDITLTSPATLGDTVDIIAFGTFALSEMLEKNQNLADLQDPAVARGNLGLGNGATLALASQGEAEVGAATDKLMTPLRVAQAITAQAGGTVDYQAFTSSGIWTKPANCKMVYVELWGGGGGGSGIIGGPGGGGGGFISRVFRASDLSATESVTVGAGGVGGLVGAGSSGGSSFFGSASVRGGGGGGVLGSSYGGVGGGGEPGGYIPSSGANIFPVGSISGGGGAGSGTSIGKGADAVYGGAGGGGGGLSGGVSSYGGNGGGSGGNGSAPGGGGGSSGGSGGGSGARGEVRVWAW